MPFKEPENYVYISRILPSLRATHLEGARGSAPCTVVAGAADLSWKTGDQAYWESAECPLE